MLGLIFAFIGFILSPKGIAVFGLGLVLFLGMPIIPQILGVGYRLANLHLWLAMQTVGRAAIVVSEHNDVYFKQMSFDDLGVEKIDIGDETKDFEDPDGALHNWLGINFALAWEPDGVLFDPRHAAAGQRKHELDQQDIGEEPATDEEWNDYGITWWKPGVFEMPTDHEIVDLSRVRELVDGGERAEYPQRVETLYKHSRDPFGSAMGSMKMLMPVIGLLAPFGMMWVIATQGGGGGGGASSSIGWGSSLLWLLIGVPATGILGKVRDTVEAIDWKRSAKYLLLALPLPVGFIALLVLTNPIFAVMIYVILGMGFWFLPVLSFLARVAAPLAGALSTMFFRLGFMAYRQPVFEWTPKRYRLRDAANLDTAPNAEWYNLFSTRVGFTFAPGEESWGPEVMSRDEVDAYSEFDDGESVIADGGSRDTNVPSNYARAPGMKRDTYGAYVPKRLKRNKYYLHSGRALNRFANSATGERSLRRLLASKEEHGGNSQSISDWTIMKLTAVTGFISFVTGVFVWFM